MKINQELSNIMQFNELHYITSAKTLNTVEIQYKQTMTITAIP